MGRGKGTGVGRGGGDGIVGPNLDTEAEMDTL